MSLQRVTGVLPSPPRDEPPIYFIGAGCVMGCISRVRRKRQGAKSSLCEHFSYQRPLRALAEAQGQSAHLSLRSKEGSPRAEPLGRIYITSHKAMCSLLIPKNAPINHNSLKLTYSFLNFFLKPAHEEISQGS
jgi:hypothetical protein